MSPAPAAAAAGKAAAEHQAQLNAQKENESESESSYERTEKSITKTTSGGDFEVNPNLADKEQQILLLLVLAGVIIFIQHAKSGKPQAGTQYAALGVVGFILLVLANFWPDIAFMFTILFVVSIILNSPNGVPIIGNAQKAVGSGSSSAGSSDASGAAAVSTKPINVPGKGK